MSVSQLDNTTAVIETAADRTKREAQRREDMADLDETRRALERRPDEEPVDIDDTPLEALDDVPDGVDVDEFTGGIAPTSARRLENDEGALTSTLEAPTGETVRVYRANMTGAEHLEETIKRYQTDRKSSREVAEFASNTLAMWSRDEAHDAEWWRKRLSIADAAQLVMQLAVGGNVRGARSS